MGQISLGIPTAGQTFATEGAKVATDMTTLQTVINGNLDSSNITNALAQSAAVNTGTQTIKGATNIATSESRTNVAYGTLTTPDQVSGIVLPTNGLIAVWYQATWQESVSNAARAAIFVGANQLVVTPATTNTPLTQAGATATGANPNQNKSLVSSPFGLVSSASSGYTGDVTTGQAVAVAPIGATNVSYDFNGSINSSQLPSGACYIFAAAGTYAISVQFKSSSGSVTALNRKLWVQAVSFS